MRSMEHLRMESLFLIFYSDLLDLLGKTCFETTSSFKRGVVSCHSGLLFGVSQVLKFSVVIWSDSYNEIYILLCCLFADGGARCT